MRWGEIHTPSMKKIHFHAGHPLTPFSVVVIAWAIRPLKAPASELVAWKMEPRSASSRYVYQKDRYRIVPWTKASAVPTKNLSARTAA